MKRPPSVDFLFMGNKLSGKDLNTIREYIKDLEREIKRVRFESRTEQFNKFMGVI